jgi:hypothetical protein
MIIEVVLPLQFYKVGIIEGAIENIIMLFALAL